MKLKNVFLSLLLGGVAVSHAQFTDDYSNPIPWNTTHALNIAVANGAATYTNCADNTQDRIYRTHGLTLTNSWRFDFDFIYSGVGSCGPGHNLATLSAGADDPVSNSSTTAAPTDQDAIAAMFYSYDATDNEDTYILVGGSKNGTDNWQWSATTAAPSTGIVLDANTQYYITLERLDQTHGRISAFTNAARTTHAAGSPQCFAIDANVQSSLTHLQHGNSSWGRVERSLTGTIDNSALSNINWTPLNGSQTVCATVGNPSALTMNAGLSSTPVYQWQSATNLPNWSNISGATAATYDPAPGLTQTTYYRVSADIGCGAVYYSDYATVTVSECDTLDCAFSDVFNLPAPWNTTQAQNITVANGKVNYTNCADNTQDRIYRAHGVTLTDSWRLNFDFTYSGTGSSGPGHNLATLSAGTDDPMSNSSTTAAPTNQDAIAAMFYSYNATNTASTYILVGGSKNNNDNWQWSATATTPSQWIVLNANTQYYITLERLDQTHGRISAFTNAARTTHTAGSPQCFPIDANVQSSLNYLQHGNTSWGRVERSLTGTIDNDCLDNITIGGGTIGSSVEVPCNTVRTLQSIAPATVPNANYSIAYQWQSSVGCTNVWSNITGATSATYTTPALTKTICYRRRATITQCGAQVFSNVVTISVSPLAGYNADFSFTTATSGTTFSISATPTTTGTGILHAWEVVELDPTTSAPIAGTFMTSSNWGASTTFPGYCCNSSATTGNGTFLVGHKYQVRHSVWDDCHERATKSYNVLVESGSKPGRTVVQVEDVTASGVIRKYMTNDVSGSISPNPSTGQVDVAYVLEPGQTGAMTVFDIQGKQVHHSLLDASGLTRVDLGHLPKGVYFCTLTVNDFSVQTEKLIISE